MKKIMFSILIFLSLLFSFSSCFKQSQGPAETKICFINPKTDSVLNLLNYDVEVSYLPVGDAKFSFSITPFDVAPEFVENKYKFNKKDNNVIGFSLYQDKKIHDKYKILLKDRKTNKLLFDDNIIFELKKRTLGSLYPTKAYLESGKELLTYKSKDYPKERRIAVGILVDVE